MRGNVDFCKCYRLLNIYDDVIRNGRCICKECDDKPLPILLAHVNGYRLINKNKYVGPDLVKSVTIDNLLIDCIE